MDYAVVIPARYDAVRLPGKPLADIGGRPMIQWVHEAAAAGGAAEVIVATDDERIVEACARFGARAEMTATAHASGTDRIAEVVRRLGWPDERVVVNVQGDEPLLPPALVSQVASLLAEDSHAGMATLVTPIVHGDEWDDPNVVKVVTDRDSRAMYFSRARIPWPRGGTQAAAAMRHVGLYAYRVWALQKFTAAPPCGLELQERLEQLRALWLGVGIRVAPACEDPPRGVDTERDLIAVRRQLAQRGSAAPASGGPSRAVRPGS